MKKESSIKITGLTPFRQAKRAFEKAYVALVLLEAGGNVSRAAQLAGKERKDFYDLMRRCHVNPKAYRS